MGASALVPAAAISGIAGLGASAMSASASSSNADKQMAAQKEAQESQNQWQSAENDKDRMWQQQEWLRQFISQNQEWQRRFDMENEYNTPSAQVARLKAAGLNPAAMLGNTGGLTAAGAADPGTSSPGQFPSHQVTPMPLQNPNGVSSSSQMYSSVAQMIESISSASRLGLESERQKKTLQATLDNIISDTNNKEAAAALTNIKSILLNTKGGDLISSYIAKMNGELSLAVAKGDTEKVQQLYLSSLKEFTDNKSKALQEVLPQIQPYFETYFDVQKTQAEKNKADAEESRASAAKQRAETITIDSLRDGQVRGQQLANTISEMIGIIKSKDAKLAEETYIQRFDALLESYEREKWLTEEQREKAKQAVVNSDWQEAEKILEAAESTSRSLLNTTGAVKNTTSSVRDLFPW